MLAFRDLYLPQPRRDELRGAPFGGGGRRDRSRRLRPRHPRGPDDDAPRLIFADWLEDHARASHAELIRTQWELARLPKGSRHAGVAARRKELAAREKALLRQPEFSFKWPAGPPGGSPGAYQPSGGDDRPKYERGFVARRQVGEGELMAPHWAASPKNRLLGEGKLLAPEIHPGQGGFQADCYPIVYEMADAAGG